MPFFHASAHEYTPGQIVGPHAESKFHRTMQDAGKVWIEVALESRRPSNAPSRHIALYACDDSAASWNFLSAQMALGIGASKRLAAITIYEVAMTNPWPAALAMVGRIDALGQGNQAILNAVDEYWHPCDGWKSLEYLDVSFTVLGIAPKPSIVSLGSAMARYGADVALARRLFP